MLNIAIYLSDDVFVEDELHNGEHPYRHCPGLHHVRINRLDGDRYNIVHKLGFGDSSTAWLALDRLLQKNVALKIKEAGISKFHNELDTLKHVSKFKSDHTGRINSVTSLLLRPFWIGGLVFQVCGPSISRLSDWNIRLRTHLARSISYKGLHTFTQKAYVMLILPLRTFIFVVWKTLIHGLNTNYTHSRARQER